MRKVYFSILSVFLLFGGLCAQAQSIAVAQNGKQVKRITFDCEKVSVIYADETKDDNVTDFAIHRETPTGIKTVKGKQGSAVATPVWYTVDGRRLQAQPRNSGVYVKKEGQRVRKIKK